MRGVAASTQDVLEFDMAAGLYAQDHPAVAAAQGKK